MIGQLLLNVLYCAGQLLAIIATLLALFSNQWIRNVESQTSDNENYFQRVANLDDEIFFTMGGVNDVFTSVGLWRLWASENMGYNLPIVDPEVSFCKFALFCAVGLGVANAYLVSFQIFGLFQKRPKLELFIGFLTVLQTLLTISATAIGLNYYKGTFEYSNFGLSLYCGFIAIVFCLLLFPAIVFRVKLAHDEEKKREKKKMEKMMILMEERVKSGSQTRLYNPNPQTLEKISLRSGSETHLYNPVATGPRPGTGDRYYHSEYKQSGTMQSQHPQEFPMRRVPSHDSKQFDMEEYRPRQYYDYNDQRNMPRDIR